MIRIEEFFPDIPRPGWPGRRRAIAAELFRVAVQTVVLIGSLVAIYGAVLLVYIVMGPES